MTDCQTCCESPTGRFFSKFSKRYARKFRKGKLEKVQELLLDGVRSTSVKDASILDIGCGVGALHLTLLAGGASSAVGVDMSDEMLEKARSFAAERNMQDKTTYINGDVVAEAANLAESDITVMDKVVCCYEHLPDLLATAAGKTRRTFALSHPREIWYVRSLFKTQIFFSELFKTAFKPWWHDWKRMEAMIEIEGLRLIKKEETAMWTVLVYERV
jgi:magnesium-protoporphyrin O-methyltransferase